MWIASPNDQKTAHKLPSRGRCVGCGGRPDRGSWYCWLCLNFARRYPVDRRN